MIEFEKTIRQEEVKSGYLNLTDDNKVTYAHHFPGGYAKLIVITDNNEYKASINKMPNQIWGGLKRWYQGENVIARDRIRVKYDPAQDKIDNRIPIEIKIIDRAESSEIDEAEETATLAEVNMQMESDLENFLAENLHRIEPNLELFNAHNNRTGRQYATDAGTIDLLCKNGDDFVVVELKKGRTGDKVVGQISRYMGWVKENLAGDCNVRGVIIVHDYDSNLKYAVAAHPSIILKYFEIKIDFITEEQVLKKMGSQ